MRFSVWHTLAFVALAVTAWAANTVDAEQYAKELKASFHWFPVQKTFLLAAPSDTLKFAIGLPYVYTHGKTTELRHAPEIRDGHIYLDSADAVNLSKPKETPASTAQTSNEKPDKETPKVTSAASAAAPAKTVAETPVTVPAAKPKNETAGTREVKTIVIDPGHGGKDTGAQGKNSNEKDIVLAIGKLLKKELEKEGFNVKMTRDKDVFIELGQRANLANQWDGDLFISLHCNAIDASAERKKIIKGYHVYVLRAPES